jgi:hypothetical protein
MAVLSPLIQGNAHARGCRRQLERGRTSLAKTRSGASAAGAGQRALATTRTPTMNAPAPTTPPANASGRFEVRSVTGACYTVVEEVAPDGSRRYRTAYAGLPVVANDDGTFTIVDTRTRLVRVDPRR